MKSNKMEVFFIRHAQTLGNIEHRYIGRTDEPLSNAGIASFCDLAYPAVNQIFTSPMLRCLQTAKILYPMMEPTIVPDFREYDFGDFERKNYEELKNQAEYRAWIASAGTQTPPNGESMTVFKRRSCDAFIQVIEQAFANKLARIACIIHGGTIMAILEHFAVPAKPFYHWQIKNLECLKADVSQTCWKNQREINHVNHIHMGD